MKAVCVLNSQTTKKGISGVVYLEETADKKTRIYGSIRGLKPGLHGFHIHEAGDMTKGCDSACAHYNPYGHNHGGLTSKKRHVGDLGNGNHEDSHTTGHSGKRLACGVIGYAKI